jgi:hypothetical protein
MISFKQYYLSERSGPIGGPNILSFKKPLGRNPGGFLGDGSTNREAMPDTLLIKKEKKGKKKKSTKPKKLDAQSTIDQPMQNRPMLNWT